MQCQPFSLDNFSTGYKNKQIVVTAQQLESVSQFLKMSPAIVFDFETDGLDWFRDSQAIGLGLAGWNWISGEIHSFYIPFRHQTGERQWQIGTIHKVVNELLGDSRPKIAHNMKFDMHFAKKDGLSINGEIYDTMIAARLFDENRSAALKARAEYNLKCFNANLWEKKVDEYVLRLAQQKGMKVKEYKKTYGYSQIPIALLGTYCCFDVEYTARLYKFYEQHRISDLYSRIWKTEMDLLPILCKMEEVGLPIDKGYLEQLDQTLTTVLSNLRNQIIKCWGCDIKIESDDFVRSLLHWLGCKLTKRTKKKALSVDKDVLASFSNQHPVIPLIMEWREANTIKLMFINGILERLDLGNVLHADIQQVGTTTGRLSCQSPNFQGQPLDSNARAIKYTGKSLDDGGADPWSIRKAYVNRGQGWMRQFWDYNQIELRVLAYYSRDPVLTDAYLRGEDIHSRTAREVFGVYDKRCRRLAKSINFGVCYGLTDIGLARQVNIPRDKASEFMRKYFERYAGIAQFRDMFLHRVRVQNGYFQNIFGRPRRLLAINSANGWEKRAEERKAIAALVQGTAAQLTKEAIVRIDKFFTDENLPAWIVCTVHDEIQIDNHVEVMEKVAKGVKKRMQDFAEFDPIPIVVDGEWTTESWSDKHSLSI